MDQPKAEAKFCKICKYYKQPVCAVVSTEYPKYVARKSTCDSWEPKKGAK
jgi:hypothetical protein